MNIKVKTALRVILIGATVVPLLVAALVMTTNVFDFAEKMIGDETGAIGASQSAGISNIVSGYLEDAKFYAGTDMVKNAVSDLNSVKSSLGDLSKSLTEKSGGNILGIAVLDSEGMIMFDTQGTAAGNTTFFAFDKESWSKNKKSPFTSKIAQKEPTFGGENVYVAVSPVESGGYFAIVASVNELTDYLSKCSFLTYGSLAVADADTVLNFGGSAVGSSSDLSGAVNLGEMISKSGSAKADGETLISGSYIGSFGKVNGTGINGTGNWVWMSLYPTAQANSSVTSIFIVGLVVIVALALICVLVMIITTQKVINPMLDMLSTMKSINSGNHKERIDTSNMGKEFSNMSDVFNDMMDQAMVSEELHRTVSDLSDNMLFEWDFSKESMFVSENFKANIGLNVSGATLNNGKFIDSLMGEDDAEKYKRDMNQLFKSKSDVGGEYQMKNTQGQDIWVSMRAHCITDRLGEVLRVVGVLTDITSEKNATLKLAERASFDFLSQLYNRNTFEREFESELERSVGKKVAALFIDVDDFKFINDRYSHAVGDETIRFVADVIKAKAGDSGFAGRFGGDEFVLCISDPKLVENVEVLSMDIIGDLYNGYFSKSVDTTLNIKASIGIAIYPDHSTDGKTLVGCADAAMYFVKKNGKANYHIYEPADNELEGNHSYSL